MTRGGGAGARAGGGRGLGAATGSGSGISGLLLSALDDFSSSPDDPADPPSMSWKNLARVVPSFLAAASSHTGISMN